MFIKSWLLHAVLAMQMRRLPEHLKGIGRLRVSPLGSPSQRAHTKYTGEVLRGLRATRGVGRPI